MAKKIRVGVLMGGPSSEREISFITGKAVFDNLNRKKYLPSIIEMNKDSAFDLVVKNKRRKLDFINKDRRLFDIIFIALHGTPGEDGTVQGMLEMLNIPYTGANTLSSALAMNKVFAAEIYCQNGIPTPPFAQFKRGEWNNKKRREELKKQIFNAIGLPAVVKPVDQGSSVGVYFVKKADDLEKMIKKSFQTSDWLMVQKFIRGEEATCSVLEKKGEPFTLPPTHILANLGEFYDYKSKYANGGSTHICPADFSKEINKKLQEMAVNAHKALGCRGMSRTDFFVTPEGKISTIETNTIPGMTPVSLLPEAAGKVGIDFEEMLDLIIKAS